MVGKAVKETDDSQILHNLHAQHRYLTWRAEKVVWICLRIFPLVRHMIGDLAIRMLMLVIDIIGLGFSNSQRNFTHSASVVQLCDVKMS